MKTALVLASVAAIGLAGCVSTSATVLGTATAEAPIEPAQVAIYRSVSSVPRPFVEVALLNSTGDSGFTNEKGMYESMRKQAAKLGANGIILEGVNEPGAGAKVAAAFLGVSAQRKGQAVAIRVEPAR